MMFIILGLLIGIVVGVVVAYNEGDSLWAFLGMPIICGFLGFAIGFLAWLLASVIYGGITDEVRVVASEQRIVSIRDAQAMEGSFVLGSGYVSDSPAFHYWTNPTPNSYNKDSVYAKDTTIVEDANVETARIVTFENEGCHDMGMWVTVISCDKSYEIHVPEGTIIKEMAIR